MKKTYLAPMMEEFAIENRMALLSGSGVSGDNGIGYGGVDDGGSLDPDAPPFEITPEKLLGLPF